MTWHALLTATPVVWGAATIALAVLVVRAPFIPEEDDAAQWPTEPGDVEHTNLHTEGIAS